MAQAHATREEEPREVVELAGELLDFAEVARYADPKLLLEAAEWAGPGATAQAVIDEYARLYRARTGAEFAQPPLRAR